MTDIDRGWSLHNFGEVRSTLNPFTLVNTRLIDEVYSTVEFMAFITHVGETWINIQAMGKALSSTDHEQATNE